MTIIKTLIVVFFIFGAFPLAFGIYEMNYVPPSSPQCQGRSMSPGDTCTLTTKRHGSTVSSETLSYSEMKDREKGGSPTEQVALTAVGSVVSIACVVSIVLLARMGKTDTAR